MPMVWLGLRKIMVWIKESLSSLWKEQILAKGHVFKEINFEYWEEIGKKKKKNCGLPCQSLMLWEDSLATVSTEGREAANCLSLCWHIVYSQISSSHTCMCTNPHTNIVHTTMWKERSGHPWTISWAAAVCVTGSAVTAHHPVCRANHRMPSSQQETINTQGHHSGVWGVLSCTEHVWPYAALTSSLMFMYSCGRMYLHTHTPHTPSIYAVCSSSTYTGIQSSALVRHRSKSETELL